MRPPTLAQTLKLDAAANFTGAAALALLAPNLAAPAGLPAPWPLWLLAAGLAAYGAENILAARRPTRRLLAGLIVADAVFAAVVLLIAVFNPSGAELWVRGLLALVGAAALTAGALKRTAHRDPTPQSTSPPAPAPSDL